MKNGETKAKRGGTPSHIELYQRIASRSDDIIECLFGLLESRNENIRLGAAKVLANKILPDKKAVELTGEDSGPLAITITSDNGNNLANTELSQTTSNL